MNVLRSHPLLTAHVVGMTLLLVAHLFLGGYDGSTFGSIVFFTGIVLSFLGWLISEASFAILPSSWQSGVHPTLPYLAALIVAYGLDRLPTQQTGTPMI